MASFGVDLNAYVVLTAAIFCIVLIPEVISQNKCQTLEFCNDIVPYNQTIYPNRLNHTTQSEGKDLYSQFIPLIKTGCSKDLNKFLCFSINSPCTLLARPIPVCRWYCQDAVTKECLNILDTMGIDKPQIFECRKLPESGLCVGANRTAETSGGGGTTRFPPLDTHTWYPEAGSFEQTDSDVVVDLFFLTAIGNNIQLLKIRSPNDMDTMTIYRGLDGNMKPAVDYFLPDKYIYWASSLNSRIYRGTLQVETLRQIVPIVDTGSAIVESLVVDWNLGVLFWSESVPVARIRTSSLSGRGVKTIVSDNMKYPISLTVDPTEGQIFWIDRKGDEFSSYSTIESFSVVTNRRRLIFNMTKFSEGSRPRALVADVTQKTLYWADARSQSLHSIQYDGQGHKVLLENHEALHEPDYLVISGDKIIWVDKLSKSLIWANKVTGDEVLQIKSFDTYYPEILRLYGRKHQINSEWSIDVYLSKLLLICTSRSAEAAAVQELDMFKFDYVRFNGSEGVKELIKEFIHKVLVTTTYKKDKLANEWKELSSRENMDTPILDDYDYRDNGYDDEDDDDNDNKKKDNNKGAGVSVHSSSVVLTLFGCIILVLLSNLK